MELCDEALLLCKLNTHHHHHRWGVLRDRLAITAIRRVTINQGLYSQGHLDYGYYPRLNNLQKANLITTKHPLQFL